MELQTFAEYLKNMSLSIDIVNDATFTRVQTEMSAYFEKLDIKFFEFLVPATVENDLGLKAIWDNGTEPWIKRIIGDDEAYNGQISYGFDRDRNLCILAGDGGKLSNATSFINQWEERNEPITLPKYVNLSDEPTFASIMIPVKGQSKNKIGIFNFEFGSNIEITIPLQEELRVLTEAFANIYVLNKANITQRRNTDKVLKTLGKLEGFTVSFKKPSIFVASSKAASEDVRLSMENVLKEYEDKVKVKYWYASNKSGDINQEIMDNIGSCTYGVCYLSEEVKQEDGSILYPDNSNVLFEAGMLHALARKALKGPKDWIPIREDEKIAGPIPFDIKTERHLIVPRENGICDKDTFETDLRNRLNALLYP